MEGWLDSVLEGWGVMEMEEEWCLDYKGRHGNKVAVFVFVLWCCV